MTMELEQMRPGSSGQAPIYLSLVLSQQATQQQHSLAPNTVIDDGGDDGDC
jgi:hypothetical protein